MITVTYLHKGKLTSGSLEKVSRLRSEVWIDCLNPGKKELHELAEHTDISYEDLTRALDEDERPGISEFQEYSVITFHAPFQDKKEGIITFPFSIFIKKNILLVLHNRPIEAIDTIKHLDDEKKVAIFKDDITYSIYILLSEVLNHYFRVSDELEEDIDRIEENVFKYQSERKAKEIFHLKKTLIYFHKSLNGNREVISGIEKQFIKEIKGRNVKKFRYLYNDAIQLIDMVGTYREILSSSLDIYVTSVSNNLNEVVKKLTIIASFVLVPTLISGIYGMNFEYMPEIHSMGRWGYPFALGLMVFSMIGIYAYFKWKKWM